MQPYSHSLQSNDTAMRYWLLLIAKLSFAAGFAAVLWRSIVAFSPHAPLSVSALEALTYLSWKLPWTLTIGAFFVVSSLLAYLCFWDQLFRCRVCCRKLRMPVTSGSWSYPLTDRPSTEYICLYGHGKLSVPEAQLTGFEASHWTFYGDIWQELYGKSPVIRAR